MNWATAVTRVAAFVMIALVLLAAVRELELS